MVTMYSIRLEGPSKTLFPCEFETPILHFLQSDHNIAFDMYVPSRFLHMMQEWMYLISNAGRRDLMSVKMFVSWGERKIRIDGVFPNMITISPDENALASFFGNLVNVIKPEIERSMWQNPVVVQQTSEMDLIMAELDAWLQDPWAFEEKKARGETQYL